MKKNDIPIGFFYNNSHLFGWIIVFFQVGPGPRLLEESQSLLNSSGYPNNSATG